MKAITYLPAAAKALSKFPSGVREAIIAKLNRYAATGAGRTKALKGRAGIRLRVGTYRVILEETKDTIMVVAAGDRRDIYR